MTKVNWKDLKEGERCRVEFECKVMAITADRVFLAGDGVAEAYIFDASELERMTFTLLPRPLAVGDEVLDPDGNRCVIEAIKGGEACMSYVSYPDLPKRGLMLCSLSDLSPIEPTGEVKP